ncbi:transposase [Tenacibaculum agarivorans]|uniref:transposase n=1 Tax=Tenacibaculum agarivorans TaxID=1908389 RepID=UPI00094B9F79|nr:transposase [Tenacibaculum agarivorans]
MKYEKIEKETYYHIYNKGNNGENIFIDEMNYSYFLNLMKKYIVPVAEIYSYCLLKNHFHLLVRMKNIEDEKIISKSFSNFFNSYSKSINKKYGRTGSLFTDRFKRIKVKDEKYLRKLIVYINLNPIYHKFVNDLNEYKHSSFLALVSSKKTLLERKEVVTLFDDRENFIFHLCKKKLDFDEKLKELILE